MADELRFSRQRATIDELAGSARRPDRFEEPVLLTGSADVLATANGIEMAHCAVLLLMRLTKSLTVALPEENAMLEGTLREWAARHAWEEVPTFVKVPVDLSGYAAILSIGGASRTDVPWTVITSNGWTLRVTSTAAPISQLCNISNPAGALAAASLGAGEVFKRLLGLPPENGRLLDGCVFSLWSYSEDDGPGPALPGTLNVDIMVAGGGAIGNGVAHLLSRLPLRGRCSVLDRQRYGEENWGTCLRLTRKGSEEPKASFLAALLSEAGLEAVGLQGDIQTLQAGAAWRTPPVILSGFDNVEARHALQDLWPDLIVDGAIGGKLECQVSAHPWHSQTACLRCVFQAPAGERAEAVQERLTGLPASALGDLTQPLSEAQVKSAAAGKREWLAKHVGKPICSVLEAAAELSGDESKKDMRPSMPFVATFSACMMTTELVRFLTTGRVAVEPRFFFSLLWGPERGDHYLEDRKPQCVCVRRARNIDRVRAGRTPA